MLLKILFVKNYKSLCIRRIIENRYYMTKSPYKQSFQNRILDYFEENLTNNKLIQQYEISTQLRDSISDNRIIKQKLESIKEQISETLSDGRESKRYINDIDQQCLSIINKLTHLEIFSILNKFLKSHPNKLKITQFYNQALILLIEAAKCELLSCNQMVELLFYVSLLKTEGAMYINNLKPLLPDLNNLPLIEKCIVAQSFYKSSMKLESNQLKVIEKVVEQNYEELIMDPLLLISVCKVIRISGPSDNLNLSNLSQSVLKSNETLNFTTTVHVLSLYAESLSFHPKAEFVLIKNCIKVISNDYTLSLRLKDIDRFLWSISYLGLTLTPNQKMILKHYFNSRYKEYKNEENLGLLVNSMLSLHMLECWNYEIIKECLQEKTFHQIFYGKFHWKVKTRLQLLLKQVRLESIIFIPKELKKTIKIQYTPSKNVECLAEIASTLINKEGIKSILLECPIYGLQIAGVTVGTNTCIYHIDVLDNTICLKNSNVPNGFMKLKLRLLRKLKYHSILIGGYIFEQDSETIQSTIEQQIINNIKKNVSNV